MALPSINEMVAKELPYLNLLDANQLAKVDMTKFEVFYLLQNELNKTDLEVEVEASYNNKQRILIAYYTAYLLLQSKALETVTGDATAGTSPQNKILSKAKASSVESEFDIIKSSDGANFALTADQIMSNLKEKLCTLANQMNISISFCQNCSVDFVPPFIFKSWGKC